MRRLWVLLILGGILAGAAGVVSATTINVPGDQSTIQAGIDAAVDGDTVLVAGGTYVGNVSITGKQIVLSGVEGPDTTILDGAGSGIVIAVGSGATASTVMCYLTVRNGGTSADGGGILCTGDSPTIHHVVVEDCTADDGGGIYISGDLATVSDCVLLRNHARDGGGLNIVGDNARILRNEFLFNTAQNAGGGILSRTSSTIRGNLFYGNQSIAQGSAYIATTAHADSFYNNTVVGNVCSDAELGRAAVSLWSSSSVVVLNNIVAQNSPKGVEAVSSNVVLDYNDVWDNPVNYAGIPAGPNDISTDPLLTDTSMGDFSLLAASPCRDAGHPDPSFNDPDGSRNDIGAFYFSSVPFPDDLNIGTENPDRVVNHTPLFFWSYLDTGGTSQSAYECEVGVDADWAVAEMWSSGAVMSSDTSLAYAGSPLADGTMYHLRLRISNGTSWGGWSAISFYMNSIPSVPLLSGPSAPDTVPVHAVQLRLLNASDFESDALAYDFEVFGDAGLTNLIESQSDISQQADSTLTTFLSNIEGDTPYWWRARAEDPWETSAWSPAESFFARRSVLFVPESAATIQLAIDLAVDGDTVLVSPDTYMENIVFRGKRIRVLSSDGPEATILTQAVGGLPIVIFESGEDTLAALEGFTIQNAVGSSSINVSATSGATILRNVITGDLGIECNAYTRIVGNTFLGSQLAISCASATGVLIDSNVIIGAVDDDGIWVVGTIGARITRNVIANTEDPLALSGGSGHLIELNVFYDNVSSDGVVDSRNCSEVIFRKNTLSGNDTWSVRYGLSLDESSDWVVSSNVFAHNRGGYGVWVRDASNIDIRYNDFFDNEGQDFWGVLPGVGNLALDPLFCDTSSDDYHIAESSPCVGGGEGGADIGALGIGCTVQAAERPSVLGIGIAHPGDSFHVTDHSPMLSWAYYDQQSRPHTQSEIEVGTDNDWSVAEMWQPATMTSADTSVTYAGLSLLDGETYWLRIRVFNDTLWSEWLEAPFRMNSLATAPTPLFPADESVEQTGRPSLVVMNATDAEGDDLRYDFQVFDDVGLAVPVAFISGLIEGFGQTSWQSDSLPAENQQHWWRTRASDGYENGPWSDVWSFWVDAFNESPNAPALVSPDDGGTTTDLTPEFSWQEAFDPDPDATLVYTLTLGLDPSFTFSAVEGDLDSAGFEWPDSLDLDTPYWWKIEADDGRGGASESEVWTFSTVPECDCPCHADPQCDGQPNVFDVVFAVGVAFRNETPVQGALCPHAQTDVDCDGDTDVFDVVHIVAVGFRNADPAGEFCEPCGL